MDEEYIISNYYEKCVYFWIFYSDREIEKAEKEYKELKARERDYA